MWNQKNVVEAKESKVEHVREERFIILFVEKNKLLDSVMKTAEHVCMSDVRVTAHPCAAKQL
jgi:uncharacterized protein YlbG (UPF0298 family)